MKSTNANAKKKLKREDFLFENGWYEEAIRLPNTLQMQQFQISDCEECEIWLFDSTACVYIDDCRACFVFVAACEASVFVRNCRNVTVICNTNQFRTRDSVYCHFYISCQSQPVIESSEELIFSCFPPFSYQELEYQLKQCQIDPWINNWYDVYDFTPKANLCHYQLERQPSNKLVEKCQMKLVKNELKKANCIVKNCLGKPLNNFFIFIVILLNEANATSSYLPFYQSRVVFLTIEQRKKFKIMEEKKELETKEKFLFLKIEPEFKTKWENSFKFIRTIIQREEIEEIENMIFVPFRDEH